MGLTGAEQVRERRGDVGAKGGLHHHVVAVGVAQLRQGAGHRRQHRPARVAHRIADEVGQLGLQKLGLGGHLMLVGTPHEDVGHGHVGRIPQQLALGQLGTQKHPAVVAGRRLDGHRIGLIGLHHDAPRQLGAPGTTSHLLDELEGTFAGPIVGQVQLGVGVNDAHEGHIVEIEAFGDHLGAQKHRRFRRTETLEQFLVRALGRSSVGVHADNRHSRPHPGHLVEQRPQICLDSLRASTELL